MAAPSPFRQWKKRRKAWGGGAVDSKEAAKLGLILVEGDVKEAIIKWGEGGL